MTTLSDAFRRAGYDKTRVDLLKCIALALGQHPKDDAKAAAEIARVLLGNRAYLSAVGEILVQHFRSSPDGGQRLHVPTEDLGRATAEKSSNVSYQREPAEKAVYALSDTLDAPKFVKKDQSPCVQKTPECVSNVRETGSEEETIKEMSLDQPIVVDSSLPPSPTPTEAKPSIQEAIDAINKMHRRYKPPEPAATPSPDAASDAGRVLRAVPRPPGAGALQARAYETRAKIRGANWVLTYEIPDGPQALSLRAGELLPMAKRLAREGGERVGAAILLRKLHSEVQKRGQVSPDQIVGKILTPAQLDEVAEFMHDKLDLAKVAIRNFTREQLKMGEDTDV